MPRLKMCHTNYFWTSVLLLLVSSSLCFCYNYDSYTAKSNFINSQLSRYLNARNQDGRYNRRNAAHHSSHMLNHDIPRSHMHTESSPFSQFGGYRTTENPHRFRHRRFQKLDGILKKLEDMNHMEEEPTTKRNFWEASPGWKGKSDRHIQKNHVPYKNDNVLNHGGASLEEYDEDVKEKDDADWTDDETENEEDEDEEDEETIDDTDSPDSEWQAQEPTQEPAKSGSLTEYKWQHYGTREAVSDSRREFLQQNSNRRQFDIQQAALQHVRRVASEGACRVPRAKLVPVAGTTDPAVTYLPHCTLLHRCGDDTGCCGATQVCVPKNTTTVHLYVFAQSLRGSQAKQLPFVNHTECHCMERTKWQQQELEQKKPPEQESQTHEDNEDAEEEMDRRGGVISRRELPDHRPPYRNSVVPEQIKKCRCTSEFISRIHGSECRCECEHHNNVCARMSRGEEYFSFKDRLCMQNNDCRQPSCEYGQFIIARGRCPNRQEKLEALNKHSYHHQQQFHHRGRWPRNPH